MAIYEYFPGANTPKGFYSYYKYILKPEAAKRIVILKGGPGTGKSTFMKKVAKRLVSLGYDIELLHCSSDPDSLDGVYSRENGFLILDGTAPHIVDPVCPGAVDEIINLGECWNSDKIQKNKDEIIRIQAAISALYADMYSYLASAKIIDVKMMREKDAYADMSIVREKAENLKRELGINDKYKKEGEEQKAFISAITPKGRINYINTFAENADAVYKIRTKSKRSALVFMNRLRKVLLENGYNIRSFYCPMSPDEAVEHIAINGIFFTVENDYHSLVKKENEHIITLDSGYIPDNEKEDLLIFNNLLDKAESMAQEAKGLHDSLEKCYVPYMDFEKISKLCDSVICSICN